MEMENIKKWLDMAHQYQASQFWKHNIEDKETSSTANPFSLFSEFFPKCDLYESDGKMVAEIEVPGISKEDVEISVNQQHITVTGEFKSLEPHRRYFLKERANRKFKKELTLPFPVLFHSVQSEIKNGILVITLPLSSVETEDIPIFIDN